MSRPLFVAIVLSAASLHGGTALAAISAERLRDDLEQGARLFRQKPDLPTATAYAARISYVEVEVDGRTITVRDPWLQDAVASLERLSPDARRRQLDAIADHLASRAALVDVPGDEPSGDASAAGAPAATGDPDAILDDILERREYRAPPEDPKLAQAAAQVRDRIRTAWQSVRNFVSNLFEPRQGGGFFEQIRSLFIMGLAALTVLGIAFFVFRALLRAAVDTAADEPETEMPEAPPQPVEMAAEAKQRAATGDHRGAIRALYLALLGRLHQQGAISYDRHRTNREYLRSMRAGPERKSAFATLVDAFDRKWYGKEPCSLEEVEAFERATLAAGDATLDRREAA